MSITDNGDYGIKQIIFLESVWGEGFLSQVELKKLTLS